jgi:tol-pal system protein YbgF
VVCLGVAVPAGWTQDTSGLADRLDRLERDLSTLESQVYKGRTAPPPPSAGSPPPSTAASGYGALDDRITAIENTLTTLTDEVERANFAARQLQSKLDRLQADDEFRFKDLEARTAGLAPPPPATSPPAAEAPPPAASAAPPAGTSSGFLVHRDTASVAPPPLPPTAPPPSPKDTYQKAFDLLRANDYDHAKPALEAFMAQYPKDPLAGNAAFWLGSIYFVEKQYDKAAVTFFDAYHSYPKSAKAAESLLHVGLSLGNLGNKKEACAALRKFSAEFPDASDDLRRQAVAEKSKQGC